MSPFVAGSLVLLVGPPAAGKSTLARMAAGRTTRSRQVHDAAIVGMAAQASTVADEDLLAEGVSEVLDAEQVRRAVRGEEG